MDEQTRLFLRLGIYMMWMECAYVVDISTLTALVIWPEAVADG